MALKARSFPGCRAQDDHPLPKIQILAASEVDSFIHSIVDSGILLGNECERVSELFDRHEGLVSRAAVDDDMLEKARFL